MKATGTPPPPTSFVTGRPVAILMLFIAAVVFGYFSYGRLPVTLMPEMTYPTLTVRTEYPGAAPEEVENEVSRPIEEALGVIGGLQKLSSVSRAELSDVVLEFGWDTDMSDATQDVLEHLDQVFLPDETKRPLILHYDPSLDPVLVLSLSGSGDAFAGEEGLRRLRRLADLQVKRELEPIKGVAAVRVKGGLEEEIQIRLDEAQLRRTGISIQQVIDRVRQENINVAGGMIQEGRTEYLVRTLNEYEDLSQIEKTIVTRFEGRDVTVGDLGTVERTHKERRIVTRTDGEESVEIEIFKEADANIVALARRIKTLLGPAAVADADTAAAALAAGKSASGKGKGGGGRPGGQGGGPIGLAAALRATEGATLKLVADRSVFIESSINEVRNTAMIGGFLAVIVLFLFLRSYGTTAIIAASIPVSLLVTFAPLHLFKTSLNIMSLGGLALGIGMLVDSSIVVLESIHRCREEGDGIVAAAIRGTSEVRAAVTASTLTTIAVFFPMVFVQGVAGQAFGDLGVAVVVSLLASLVVALFLIPMLASRTGLRVERFGDAEPGFFRFASIAVFARSLRESRRLAKLLVLPVLYWVARLVVGLVLEFLGKVLLGLFMVFAFLVVRVVAPGLRRVLGLLAWLPLRMTDAVLAWAGTAYPASVRWALGHRMAVFGIVGAALWGTWILAAGLESELLPEVRQGEFTVEVALPVGTPLEATHDRLKPLEEAILAERKHIQAAILTVGYDPAQSERSDEGEHTASLRVLLGRGGARHEEKVMARMRERFAGIPDLEAQIKRPVLFSSRTPIEVEIHGDDLRMLKEYTDRAEVALAGMPELADVNTTLRTGAPEIQVVYDRERLSRYGLSLQTVARLVRDKVQGFEATRFNLPDRRIPVVVQLNEEDRRSVDAVEEMVINPGGERPVRLSSVASVILGEGPSEVRRIDSRRVGLVRANLGNASLSDAVGRIDAVLRDRVEWPAGMTYFISGQNEEWQRSQGSLVLALALSIFLVYVIMAVQFESLIHPLVIMITIPLAFIGTVVALKALGIPVSVVVFLGMIMLAGIVVNNAIVLVDYINQLRRRGMPVDEAIVTAGSVRLRPILMTTATTVLGLLPMALGLGDGAEIRTPMAIAVISGLVTSTFLTLLVIPTVYTAADGLMARLFHARDAGEASAPARAAEPVRPLERGESPAP